MTPGTIALVLAQLVLLSSIGWAVSSLALRWARIGDLGFPERAFGAVVGFLLFSVGAMFLNIAAGGLVFGTPGVVPALALLAVLAWVRTGLRDDLRLIRLPRAWLGGSILCVALFLLYVLPPLLEGSGVRTGDPPWHLGWTEQLLGGLRLPQGPAAEYARNAYPWGHHAFLASLVRLVPGSTPLIAHETVHVALVGAIPLAAACIARRVDRTAGLAAAACASLIGGFGWVLARTAAFVPSPRASRFGADLVAASPNSVYELLPPALPRELGLVTAGAAALLLLVALQRDTARARIAAGTVAGLVGVVSVPMLFTALLWAVVGCFIAGRPAAWRPWAQILGPAILVFALWAGPVAVGYLRHGGFVDITPRLGMEWPLPTALASWGLLLPLSLAGLAVVRRREGGRIVAALGISSAALLGLAVARETFGWSVWNNATLLHQGRMWPPAHLVAAALAGLALVRLHQWLRLRSRALAGAAVAAVLAIGGASPVFASMRMRELLDDGSAGFVYGDEDFADGSFLRAAGSVLGPEDVVFVEGPDLLGWSLFQMSGARLARYDDQRFDRNDLRIRYADLAAKWDAAIAAGGFDPTHLVVGSASYDPSLGETVARGDWDGTAWTLVRVR